LQSFPFDSIKVDRTFLANPNQILYLPPLVRVIGPERHLFPVVAESVEIEENAPFFHTGFVMRRKDTPSPFMID
jgi:hypothetical protein